MAVIHVLLGYAFMAGLTVALPGRSADAPLPLIVLKLMPPPVREPPLEPRAPAKRAGAAAAPGAQSPLRANTPVPVISVPPRPIVVPSGASGDNPAGQGTAGVGVGAGPRGAGSGEGEGIGDGRGFSSARQVRGRFRNSDFPASVKGAGRLRIGVRYAVGPSGRVDRCEVIESSGYPEVDAMTCRVIVDRYRFRPARDDLGIPITEVLEEDYWWTMR